MYFDEFWKKLEAELKVRAGFETLRHLKPFRAKMLVGRRTIEVTPGSGKPRKVKRSEFGSIWGIMKAVPAGERYVDTGGEYTEMTRNASYILALIHHVVGDGDMSGARPRRRWRT